MRRFVSSRAGFGWICLSSSSWLWCRTMYVANWHFACERRCINQLSASVFLSDNSANSLAICFVHSLLPSSQPHTKQNTRHTPTDGGDAVDFNRGD
ncbi:hypothetical protein BCR44DRAFT_252648 [Catenaria anguillulae PL171]|uniref:Uncharacterized protein n=1 Tax=Catenaria anguillulae PL171 TaxID=765915 RepID=A0A1Y2I120_9FUNG|nr:hypothetical protein BCR44DRAFT_252648 [Catenaria anguillulae PL171]